MEPSRRAFLRGRPATPPTSFRPPWALAEASFLAVCTRCDACIAACPTGLLQRGDGGYPVPDFHPGHAPAGCTFCGRCAEACQPRALLRRPDAAPWPYRVSIGEDCLPRQGVVCRTCGERCEAGAFRFPPRLGGVSLPVLATEQCTGCGACLADCPTHALRLVLTAPRSDA